MAIRPTTRAPDLDVATLAGDRFKLAQRDPMAFTLIVVYRDHHCPICRSYLRELDRKLDGFTARGVDVVAVSTDTAERAGASKREWEPGHLTVGHGLSVADARQWGVFVSKAIADREPAASAEPGLFLFRLDGTLHAASIQTGPFARPPFPHRAGGSRPRHQGRLPAARGRMSGSAREEGRSACMCSCQITPWWRRTAAFKVRYPTEELLDMMPTRFPSRARRAVIRVGLLALTALASLATGPAFAGNGWIASSASAFAAAQAEDKVIVVDVHADWCPTCRRQAPILAGLLAGEPALADVVALKVDFDRDRDFLVTHRVLQQSTILVFQGTAETARSIGETDPERLRAAILAGLPN
jgi:peroxiredoxin/thiol-disulfide isomerase/thioredoxin